MIKEYLIAIAWMVFWAVATIPLTTCINLPPPAPMGDGAVQQYGLINVANDDRVAYGEVPQKPPTTVSVTDKGIAITMPKK